MEMVFPQGIVVFLFPVSSLYSTLSTDIAALLRMRSCKIYLHAMSCL